MNSQFYISRNYKKKSKLSLMLGKGRKKKKDQKTAGKIIQKTSLKIRVDFLKIPTKLTNFYLLQLRKKDRKLRQNQNQKKTHYS